MKRKIGLQKHLTFSFTLISILIMAISGSISYFFDSNLVRDLTVSNLNNQIKSIEAAIDITVKDGIEREHRLMDYWAPNTIPTILNDKTFLSEKGELQEHHELVDRIAKETRGLLPCLQTLPKGSCGFRPV